MKRCLRRWMRSFEKKFRFLKSVGRCAMLSQHRDKSEVKQSRLNIAQVSYRGLDGWRKIFFFLLEWEAPRRLCSLLVSSFWDYFIRIYSHGREIWMLGLWLLFHGPPKICSWRFGSFLYKFICRNAILSPWTRTPISPVRFVISAKFKASTAVPLALSALFRTIYWTGMMAFYIS